MSGVEPNNHAGDVVGGALLNGQLYDCLGHLLCVLVFLAKLDGLVVGHCIPHSVGSDYQKFVEWAQNVPYDVGLSCYAEALVCVVSEGSGDGKATSYSVVHDRASSCPDTVYFLRVGGLVIFTHPLSLAIFAEYNPSVSRISNIHHVVVYFSAHHAHRRRRSAVIRIQHSQLSIYFQKYLLQNLIKVRWRFGHFFFDFYREGIGTVLSHLLSTVAIKDGEEAAGRVAG